MLITQVRKDKNIVLSTHDKASIATSTSHRTLRSVMHVMSNTEVVSHLSENADELSSFQPPPHQAILRRQPGQR